MADDFPAEAVAIVQRRTEDEHGYLLRFNTRVDAIECGRIMMIIPYDEKLTNTVSPPMTHGGTAMTLIDTTGGIALRTMPGDPLVGGVTTINSSMSYLRRALGDLTAVIEVVRADGSVGVSTIIVVSTDPEEDSDVVTRQPLSSSRDDVVAIGQGAYRLSRE